MSSCSDLTIDHENLNIPETLDPSKLSENSQNITTTSEVKLQTNSNFQETVPNALDTLLSTQIMNTLTYENSPASFFTTNKYTNLPYNILGTEFENEDDVKQAVEARPWFTYRRDFPQIGDSSFTSDAGWGCAVRVGQMLLAEVFNRLKTSDRMTKPGVDVLEKFGDTADGQFSLQKLVLAFAGDDDSKIGTWLGPNNVCHSIKQLIQESNIQRDKNSSENTSESPRLQVHVCMDSTVVIPELPSIEKSPILLFLPLRLGLDSINAKIYGDDILESISFPQSVGIIGGRPRTAYYFFGHSKTTKELLALDPHTVKQHKEVIELDEYTCESPLFIKSVEDLDPTMALGFLARTQVEFDDLIHRLTKSKLCAIMKSLPKTDFEFSGNLDNLDVDLPDTDDEFEILC